MKIVANKISVDELKQMAQEMFGDLIKAVVDIDKEIIAINAELHSDEESSLIENGSENENLWGINIYPNIQDEDWIEFDSMINIRPSQNNNSRGIDNPEIKTKIIRIVNKLVQR